VLFQTTYNRAKNAVTPSEYDFPFSKKVLAEKLKSIFGERSVASILIFSIFVPRKRPKSSDLEPDHRDAITAALVTLKIVESL